MTFYSRKSPRIPGYDYASDNYYFVTICTHEKKCIFGSAEKLSPCGMIVEEHLRLISKHFAHVKLDKWVVMPNHVHAIVVIGCDGSNKNVNLNTVIGLFKSGVTRQIHEIIPELTVWQRSYHDRVIRSQPEYEKIWAYIDTNPQRWNADCFYCE